MSKCAASLSRSTRVSVARCSVFRRPCPIKTTCRYQALNVTFTPCWQRINNAIAATVEPYSSRHYSVQTKLPRTRTAHKLSQAKANGQPRRDPTSLTAGKRRIDTSLQLLHLKDPFKLAVHVKSILNKDQFVKAQALVHAASKGSSSYTVSWNHLINFQMRQGKVEAAMKTYNDMKKRGHSPDAYTYALLLRGLARNAHYPRSPTRAKALFRTMSTPKSSVAPTVMHANTVLKVCARAGDADSLWDVAAEMPKKGPGAPDSFTFTTLLNAIRHGVEAMTGEQGTEEQLWQRKAEEIRRGRGVWADVIGKWRGGYLRMDEELVCAMGRLLLTSDRPEDWDDVLSLAQQSFDLPRTTPPYATRRDGHHSTKSSDAHPDNVFRDVEQSTNTSDQAGLAGTKSPANDKKKAAAFRYAVPGRNALGLVIEACSKLRLSKPTADYWSLLTDESGFAVVPDGNNYVAYLRHLRFMRASQQATEVLRDQIVKTGQASLIRKTLGLAMNACVRDTKNERSFDYAGQILDLMGTTLAKFDARTLLNYADRVASATDKTLIVEGLRRLQPLFEKLQDLLEKSDALNDDFRRKDAVEIAKKMTGCYDRLLNGDDLSQEDRQSNLRQSKNLSAFVTTYKAPDDERVRPGKDEQQTSQQEASRRPET